MRDYQFTVLFGGVTAATTRREHVVAGNKAAATILAQAEQIKKGNKYDDVIRVNIHPSDAAAYNATKAAHHGLTGE